MSEPAVVRSGDAASKQALLQSALRLFVRDGLCETTVRAVAADAGYTNPAIFKFFRGRDALSRVIFERCYERLAGVIAQAATMPEFETRLRAIVAAVARFMDTELDAFLFVNEQLRRFWPQVGSKLRSQSIVGALRDLFVCGAAEGKVASDHDPALLVSATIGTLTQFGRGLYFGEIEGPAVRRVPELERLLLRIAW